MTNIEYFKTGSVIDISTRVKAQILNKDFENKFISFMRMAQDDLPATIYS